MTGPRDADAAGRSAAMRGKLLAERTQRLARPAADTAVQRQVIPDVLVCAEGRGLYGLPMDGLAKVTPFAHAAALPGQPAAMLGVHMDGGLLFHVFDLAAFLSGTTASRAPGFAIALRHARPRVALRFDRVLGVAAALPLTDGEARSLPEPPAAVSRYARSEGAGELDGPVVAVIDLNLLRTLLMPPSS